MENGEDLTEFTNKLSKYLQHVADGSNAQYRDYMEKEFGLTSYDYTEGIREGLNLAANWHRKQAETMQGIIDDCNRGLITSKNVKERAELYKLQHENSAIAIKYLRHDTKNAG